MFRIFIATIVCIILVSCEGTNTAFECPGENEFNVIQTKFWSYQLYLEDKNLFAFFRKYDQNSDYEIIKTSSDNGYTWETKCEIKPDSTQGLVFTSCDICDFMESRDDSYWILTDFGIIFKSTDQGTSWVRKNASWWHTKDMSEFELSNPNSMHIDNNGIMYLVEIWKGIFRSTDNGENWEYIVHEETAHDYVQFFDDKILCYQRDKDLMISYNNGDSWIKPDGIDSEDMTYFSNNGSSSSVYSMIEGEDSFLPKFLI